jgi:hypothetical protein
VEEEEEEGPVQGASETFCDARKHSTRGEEGGEARRMLHRIETLAPPSLTTIEHRASRIAHRERTANKNVNTERLLLGFGYNRCFVLHFSKL